MDFNLFKTAVAKQFARMSAHPLFRTGVEKDALWQTYLDSFPEGTNPIYKTRREYDCNCCKSFIRTVGDVVAVIDGAVVSLWDIDVPEPFQTVANAMSRVVTSRGISDAFLHYEPVAGTDKTLVQALEGVHTWRHFFVNLPRAVVAPKDTIPTKLGDLRSSHDVFARSLDTITPDAIDTVLDLINENSLYRGAEHKVVVEGFRSYKTAYDAKRADDRDVFAWLYSSKIGSVARIRNTAIGTLLVDLSEGVDVDRAVASFESKVAPTNYKRPTAVVTKGMIEVAKKKIEELGLGSALQRRYAVLEDITVNNVIYANRNARRSMNADVFDSLLAAAPVKSNGKTQDIAIDTFLRDVLPRADSLELMFENRHTPNLVSLIAPTDPTARPLFKWSNPFSWSYNGEFADSIKERVKQAGGNVTGDLCCRLSWSNYDDLDLHMIEPDGHEIYFGNARRFSRCGGMLDVDMNAGRGTTRTPVENIVYPDRKTMRAGTYRLFVHNFCARDQADKGFEVEIDWLGTVHRFACPRHAKNNESVTVLTFRYNPRQGLTTAGAVDGRLDYGGLSIVNSLPSATASRGVWGVQTQTYQPVNVVMLSPNHWDGRGVGNKHYFFMLEACRNEGKARGFYNEFLLDDLTPHRKVIETVGSKLRTDESDRQLSGLGFSSTQRNNVVCRVNNRTFNITF